MNRGKRRKRINYYGHHYFEGDAVRALAPTPQDYGFADLDDISVLSDEVAKWNAARDKFSWSWTAVIAVVITSTAVVIWDWNVLYFLLLPPVWLLGLILSGVLDWAYGEHPSAARLAAFKGAAARWHRTAEPFAEHEGAIRGWIRMSASVPRGSSLHRLIQYELRAPRTPWVRSARSRRLATGRRKRLPAWRPRGASTQSSTTPKVLAY
jgi:hypothetical protein